MNENLIFPNHARSHLLLPLDSILSSASKTFEKKIVLNSLEYRSKIIKVLSDKYNG